MDFGVSAARWAVDKALGLATDELVKSWRASSDLGQNAQELKRHLLQAQALLESARQRDVPSGGALEQQLQQLGNIAYSADDVLDEIEYFRIQDQLEGTRETADDSGGIILNLRHTVKAVTSKLNCSCLDVNRSDADKTPDTDNEGDQEASRGCVSKIFSTDHNTVDSVCCPGEQGEMMTNFLPKLRSMAIKNCPKLLSLPPIPCSNDLCYAQISKVGTRIKMLDYEKSEQKKRLHVEMEYRISDSKFWNMLAFCNLRELETLCVESCPPVPLDHIQHLACLKILSIANCSSVLEPVEGATNTIYQCTVEHLSIYRCDAKGKELTRLLSYFPNLTHLHLYACPAVTQLGVAEKQVRATLAAGSPASYEEIEDGSEFQHQQKEARCQEKIDDAEKGLLLLPAQIQDLNIQSCSKLRLWSCSFNNEALHGLVSLRRLLVVGCKFLSSGPSSSCCPFPYSLEELSILYAEGMFTLAPLPNLTKLYLEHCDILEGDDLWPLLAHDNLTKLSVKRSPNLFISSEPPPVPKTSRLLELRTDNITGALVVPVCAQLSSSLTKLCILGNGDMECFTKEQEEAIQKLTKLEELEIGEFKKLQSLPAGLSGLRNLKKMEIRECEPIRLIPRDGLPDSLTELQIYYCRALQSLCKDGFPRALAVLIIVGCPALPSWPNGSLPSSLQTLDVSDSWNDDLKSQCHKLRGTIPIIKASVDY